MDPTTEARRSAQRFGSVEKGEVHPMSGAAERSGIGCIVIQEGYEAFSVDDFGVSTFCK